MPKRVIELNTQEILEALGFALQKGWNSDKFRDMSNVEITLYGRRDFLGSMQVYSIIKEKVID
jgi:hypothetical protein